jgi:glycosidase
MGYVHEDYPAFLRACDDVARGIISDDTRLFLWSADGDGALPPPDEHFLQGSDGRWFWSERAGSHFWVKWEGDHGGLALPQLDWADPGWQRQAGEIIDFWLATGADGLVVDAVNWYIGCDWQILRATISDRQPDTFLHPEGAGGFGDDPVTWIADGGCSVIMDYGLKIWWDDIDVVRDAVRTGNHAALEAALRSFRDRVDAAGGTCMINPPRMSSAPVAHQRLAAAVVATVGELFFDAFGVGSMTPAYRAVMHEVLRLRADHPALAARGAREQIECSHPAVYAFTRGTGEARVLVAMNFSSQAAHGHCQVSTVEGPVDRVAIELDPYDVVVVGVPDPDLPA